MRRQNSWTDPTSIGERRETLSFHEPGINSISGNVVIRPFPSQASKFPPRRLTTWLASPGLIRTRPLHTIERNWLHASHPLTKCEAVDCCGDSLPVPLFGSRSFNERPLCAKARDRGEPFGSAPPTPPCVRVRTRRFEKLRQRISTRVGRPSDLKWALESPTERALLRARCQGPRPLLAILRSSPETRSAISAARRRRGVFH